MATEERDLFLHSKPGNKLETKFLTLNCITLLLQDFITAVTDEQFSNKRRQVHEREPKSLMHQDGRFIKLSNKGVVSLCEFFSTGEKDSRRATEEDNSLWVYWGALVKGKD